MKRDEAETEALLRAAVAGEDRARQGLLERHRRRLRQMVQMRLDRRVTARVDPSDIVQEALVDAARKLDAYLRDRPLPFYPWLHRLAAERLAQAHRRNLGAQARTVAREQPGGRLPSGDSAHPLVERLVDSGAGPIRRLLREELRQGLGESLGRLGAKDREVLVMYYLEGLAFAEVAAILGITENAAKVRHFRALERLRKLMELQDGEGLSR